MSSQMAFLDLNIIKQITNEPMISFYHLLYHMIKEIPLPQDSPFPLFNIPFGVVQHQLSVFPATRYGDHVINLAKAESDLLFSGPLMKGLRVFQGETLNQFMSLSRAHWKQVRSTLQQLIVKSPHLLQVHQINSVKSKLPCHIGDYTDFYSSRNHAFNVGSIIRGPQNALQENWLHLPVGYHGRSSSIQIGRDVRRPRGQTKAPTAKTPSFTQSKRLDFQVQIGAFLGGALNQLGSPIKVNEASEYIFGLVLLNDWSARDLQTWEYVPLGPFTAKNLITTISPWIITMQALQPFKVQLPKQQPQPMSYLDEKEHISYDIDLFLNINAQRVVTTNFKYLYWSIAQQLAHHAVSGCNMRPGDLLGSGTISGTQKSAFGCLLQQNWGGKEKVGERMWLQDGDEVQYWGESRREGSRIGFGSTKSKILAALPQDRYW